MNEPLQMHIPLLLQKFTGRHKKRGTLLAWANLDESGGKLWPKRTEKYRGYQFLRLWRSTRIIVSWKLLRCFSIGRISCIANGRNKKRKRKQSNPLRSIAGSLSGIGQEARCWGDKIWHPGASVLVCDLSGVKGNISSSSKLNPRPVSRDAECTAWNSVSC